MKYVDWWLEGAGLTRIEGKYIFPIFLVALLHISTFSIFKLLIGF